METLLKKQAEIKRFGFRKHKDGFWRKDDFMNCYVFTLESAFKFIKAEGEKLLRFKILNDFRYDVGEREIPINDFIDYMFHILENPKVYNRNSVGL